MRKKAESAIATFLPIDEDKNPLIFKIFFEGTKIQHNLMNNKL